MSLHERMMAPARISGIEAGGISPRGRMAVIAGLSVWLWAGILTIGYYAIG